MIFIQSFLLVIAVAQSVLGGVKKREYDGGVYPGRQRYYQKSIPQPMSDHGYQHTSSSSGYEPQYNQYDEAQYSQSEYQQNQQAPQYNQYELDYNQQYPQQEYSSGYGNGYNQHESPYYKQDYSMNRLQHHNRGQTANYEEHQGYTPNHVDSDAYGGTGSQESSAEYGAPVSVTHHIYGGTVYEGSNEYPGYGQQEQSQGYGQYEQTPVYNQQEQTPGYGKHEQTPAYGQNEQTPAYGQHEQTPDYGGGYENDITHDGHAVQTHKGYSGYNSAQEQHYETHTSLPSTTYAPPVKSVSSPQVPRKYTDDSQSYKYKPKSSHGASASYESNVAHGAYKTSQSHPSSGSHGKATSYQSFVLHSFNETPLYLKSSKAVDKSTHETGSHSDYQSQHEKPSHYSR